MSRFRISLLCLALFAGDAPALVAQSLRASTAPLSGTTRDERRATAQRTERAPAIDGRLNDVAWRDVAALGDFVQQSPDEGKPATQRTEVRMLMDDVSLYVAMRLFDSAPDSIAGPLARRDYTGYSDWAHVIIDSYHDRRTAFRFAVNPSGVKRDGYISGDAEWREDPGWDAVWDVATSRDSAGWSAEFRIPLSQLRFSTGNGASEWGIEFIRDLARRDERAMWAPIPRSAERFVSLFGTLEQVRTNSAPRRLEFTPYTLARRASNAAVSTNPLVRARDGSMTAGADFKIGITSDLTLTGTVNPDFGQVEADPSEVNLTGVETFFRERRPFFVEGGDMFQYGLTQGEWVFGGEQLFYSRRIGRAPQGRLPSAAAFTTKPTSTSLLGAAKLIGLVSGWRLGTLTVATQETRGTYAMANGTTATAVVEPLTHYGVVRASRDFDQGNSSLGVIATAVNRRLGDSSTARLHDGAYAGGLEGRWRFGPGKNLGLSGYVFGSTLSGSRASLLQTQTNTTRLFQRPDDAQRVDSAATSMSGFASELRFERTGGMPRIGVSAHVVSRGFDVNNLGFQSTSGYESSVGWLGWEFFTPTRFTRQHAAWVNGWSLWGADGERRMTGGNLWTRVEFHNFWQLTSVAGHALPGRSAVLLRGGPTVRTPSALMYNVRLASDPRRAVVGELATFGRALQDGGSVTTVAPTATFRPSGRLELQLQPSVGFTRDRSQYVGSPTNASGTHYLVGDLRQRTTSVTARVNYAFTTALTLQGYAQPFVSAGRYAAIGEVVNADAARWSDRVRSFTGVERTTSADGTRLTLASAGGPLAIDNPDFNVGDFNANAVLRWEYRPGSTMFVVWNQRRAVDAADLTGATDELSRELARAPAATVFLLKWSHYFGR